MAIRSFTGALARDLFLGRESKATRAFPPQLRAMTVRKLQLLNAASRLSDLKAPPGNRLEALKGDLAGYHSIRVNDQFRIVFRWRNGAEDVSVIDYH